MVKDKGHINLVTIGHVDSGKSTLTGHLIYKLGGIDKRTIEKFEKESEEMGKGSFKYAWVLDKLKSEREKGTSIKTVHWKFETAKYMITLLDCPGEKSYIKQTIAGISQGDAAVLFVSATKGEYEAGIAKEGQTREHLTQAYSLGIRQLIVVINKMDDNSVEYSNPRYEEIKKEVSSIAKKNGFRPKKIPFIPTSGWDGENLLTLSDNMSWYKGPTMVEALDTLKEPRRNTGIPFRFPIMDSYKIGGIGTVVIGKIQTGVVKPGDKVIFTPGGRTGEVKSIEMHHEALWQGTPGDAVGLNIKGISHTDLKKGMVASLVQKPAKEVKKFIAQVIMLKHPGEIKVGYTPILHCHTAYAPCKISEIKQRLDKRTGKVIEKDPKTIKAGDAAIVTFEPQKSLVVEPFKTNPTTGRFLIRDLSITVGVGIINSVET